MAETFTCDKCGNEFPADEMKEAFVEEGGEQVKKTYDAKCLDDVMNASDDVQGVEGDEKQAAVALDADDAASERESYGERK